MANRIIDDEIVLVKYYPNHKTALKWYQDEGLCRQLDNRDHVYDSELLRSMYKYLDDRGMLFYIKYKNRLCGDVCLHPDGEINIVVAKEYQNNHIGRRVVFGIIDLAREMNIDKLYATIYSFNAQSRKMFESVGFKQVADERYEYAIPSDVRSCGSGRD